MLPAGTTLARNSPSLARSMRRHHVAGVARLQLFVDPVREGAALDLAHADAQFAVVDAGADRVRAAQVLPLDVLAQREVLALGEAEGLAQVDRDVEGDDDG